MDDVECHAPTIPSARGEASRTPRRRAAPAALPPDGGRSASSSRSRSGSTAITSGRAPARALAAGIDAAAGTPRDARIRALALGPLRARQRVLRRRTLHRARSGRPGAARARLARRAGSCSCPCRSCPVVRAARHRSGSRPSASPCLSLVVERPRARAPRFGARGSSPAPTTCTRSASIVTLALVVFLTRRCSASSCAAPAAWRRDRLLPRRPRHLAAPLRRLRAALRRSAARVE